MNKNKKSPPKELSSDKKIDEVKLDKEVKVLDGPKGDTIKSLDKEPKIKILDPIKDSKQLDKDLPPLAD
jgi:hypothetical protein